TGGGVELGYRYYTGSRGMNGLFLGPSFIFGIYSASFGDNERKGFSNAGVALDGGVQVIFFDHLTLGAGVGMEYINVSQQYVALPLGPAIIPTSGFKPRLLASAGFAF